MTSQFTPAPECATRKYTIAKEHVASWDEELRNNATLTCSDPAWVIAQSDQLYPTTHLVFDMNPLVGLCPTGYDIVGTRTITPTYAFDTSASKFFFDFDPDLSSRPITEAYCCPGGFTSACATEFMGRDFFNGCQKYITDAVEVLQTNPAGTTTMSSFTAHDRGYWLRWLDLQTPYFTPTEAFESYQRTSQYAVFAPTSEPVKYCPSSTPNGNPPKSSSTNSHSALIGGIVGGVLALLVCIAFIFWCMRRRRRTSVGSNKIGVDNGKSISEVDGEPSKRAELSGKGLQVSEADAGLVQELPNEGAIHELDSRPHQGGIHELDSRR